MKIVMPLNNITPIDVVDVADEFYFGLYDDEWNTAFSNDELNRRTVTKLNGNFKKIEDVEKFLFKAENKKFFCVFNSIGYTIEQINFIKRYFDELKKYNIGIIASNYLLIKEALKNGVDVAISSTAGVYNSLSAGLYCNMGINKIILPRDLDLQAINNIVNTNRNINFEVFLFNERCVYSDAHCYGMHSDLYDIPCYLLKKSKQMYLYNNLENGKINSLLNRGVSFDAISRSGCSLCALYDIIKTGVSHGKICGRSNLNIPDLIIKIKKLKSIVSYIESGISKDEYDCFLKKEIKINCVNKNRCYYN